tara:strand:+ start:270 stop:413 length:144 start_codon:yes stop_codon:yes gene_type:complete
MEFRIETEDIPRSILNNITELVNNGVINDNKAREIVKKYIESLKSKK